MSTPAQDVLDTLDALFENEPSGNGRIRTSKGWSHHGGPEPIESPEPTTEPTVTYRRGHGVSIDKIDWYFARHHGTSLHASFEPVDITEVIASGILRPFQQVEWRRTPVAQLRSSRQVLAEVARARES